MYPNKQLAQRVMAHSTEDKLQAFSRLLTIMDELREGCPWDREQTMESLRNLTIEETYELVDAIIDNDMVGIREELGDLFLHLVFYARIADEQGAFDVADVLNKVCEKLVHRHPHIYGDVKIDDAEGVKRNWEKLKLSEGKKSVLGGVPISLPALIKAQRIQEKAAKVGFEWRVAGEVWAKVEEEAAELQREVGGPNQRAIEEEFGDLLFALVNYGRFIGVEPETALEKCNRKFKERFEYIERRAAEEGRKLDEMTLDEMDGYWEEAKRLKMDNEWISETGEELS